MTALASRRRNRTLAALGAGVLVMASIPVLGVAAWRAIRDSTAAQNIGVITALAIPSTPAALLVGLDDTDQVASITVLALRPEGGGGTIVSVPVGARSESSPGNPRRVADAYTVGGVDALEADVSSLMNVTFSQTAVMKEKEIARLLGGLDGVSVDLPSDLRDSEGGGGTPDTGTPDTGAPDTGTLDTAAPDTVPTDGTDVPADATSTSTTVVEAPTGDPDATVVVPQGSSTLTADDLAAALTAREEGAPESEHLPDLRAVWEGVAASVGEGIGTPPSTGASDPASMEEYMAELLAGPLDVWQLGYTPLTGDDNPEGLDLYNVDRSEVVLVMASVAPSAVNATLLGPSVQIDSAFGDAELSQKAVGILLFAGVNVLLVREVAGPPPENTQIRYARVGGGNEDFDFLGDLVGAFDIEQVDERVEGIDFQIVLGQSFKEFADTFDMSTVSVPPDDGAATTAPSVSDPTTTGNSTQPTDSVPVTAGSEDG